MRLLGFDIQRAGRPRPAERSGIEQGNGTGWLQNLFAALAGPKTVAGAPMNEYIAWSIGAVYTSVRIVSGTISSLPLHVYRRDEEGRQTLASRYWAYPLLHDSPNAYHSSFVWRELLVSHLMLWGNSYNRIEWMRSGTASELLPLMPWTVEPYRTEQGEQRYRVREGSITEDLPADEVLHVPGLGYDGIRGVSVIQAQREALGLARAMENFTASFFGNGAKPGAILEVPSRMEETAQQNLALSIAEKFGSSQDAFKVLVLEEGAKLHTYTMPLEDAQLLESRKFSRSEIFGWYGVPPHLAGDTERQTSWGTGIEQMDIGYAKHTIIPWLARIEQELARKLFGRGSGFYARFSLEGLLRGDFRSRMEGYAQAAGGPFLSRNEVRELEDWPRLAGDEFNRPLRPMAMSTLEETEPEPEPTPAPAASAPESEPTEEDEDMRGVKVEVAAPVVNVAAPEVNLAPQFNVRLDDETSRNLADTLGTFRDSNVRLDETLQALGQAVRGVGEATRSEAARTRQALEASAEQLELGLVQVAARAAGPRRVVFDAEGNPIGSEPVETLPGK
jgi:HK97 family phage portal protein